MSLLTRFITILHCATVVVAEAVVAGDLQPLLWSERLRRVLVLVPVLVLVAQTRVLRAVVMVLVLA
jgi:hypothetical protein